VSAGVMAMLRAIVRDALVWSDLTGDDNKEALLVTP